MRPMTPTMRLAALAASLLSVVALLVFGGLGVATLPYAAAVFHFGSAAAAFVMALALLVLAVSD